MILTFRRDLHLQTHLLQSFQDMVPLFKEALLQGDLVLLDTCRFQQRNGSQLCWVRCSSVKIAARLPERLDKLFWANFKVISDGADPLRRCLLVQQHLQPGKRKFFVNPSIMTIGLRECAKSVQLIKSCPSRSRELTLCSHLLATYSVYCTKLFAVGADPPSTNSAADTDFP